MLHSRAPLSRERVLRVAVDIADDTGLESLSMRRLAQALGVVPMALYRHVSSKEELVDGMVDLILGEIEKPSDGIEWKRALRERILSARRALLRHPWAARALESRKVPTPALLAYLDSVIGMLRTAGLSVDLTHHVMHALGSRLLGFTQKLFDDPAALNFQLEGVISSELAATLPYIAELATAVPHHSDAEGGPACDEQFEFEFALDLLLDGIERLWLQEQNGNVRTLEP